MTRNDRLSCRSSSGLLDSMTDSAAVINRKSLRMEAQLKFVNSNKEGMKIENHFKDEGGEFD